MAENLNLTPERGPNVWKEAAGAEGWRCAVGAGALIVGGVAAVVAGARMLYHVTSESRRAKQPGQADTRQSGSSAAVRARRADAGSSWSPGSDVTGATSDDLVDEESMQSFPASDAPSWTGAQSRRRE